MSLLTNADLAYMRAMQAAALPDTCSISRPADVLTPTGGVVRTYATVATMVKFRLSTPFMSMRAGEAVVADRASQAATFIATFERGTDVRISDRIVFGTRTLEVTGYATGSWETAMRVTVSEVT